MVAERSIYLERFIVVLTEEIRTENVDMSNDKQCVIRHCRLRVLGFQNKANPFW